MSLINLRYLPKHTFTSIIFPYIKTYHNELAVLADNNINIGDSKFTLNNNIDLNYTIEEMHKTININTKISTILNEIPFNIHENITIKKNINNNKVNDYSNYSINIVNLIKNPYIHSIKCIHQPISFDLMNHYTDDIKQIYQQIINKNVY
jgi:hypothetical protein